MHYSYINKYNVYKFITDLTNGNCLYVTVIKLINGFGFLLVVVRIIKLKEKYKNGSSSIIVNIYFNCSYLKKKTPSITNL